MKKFLKYTGIVFLSLIILAFSVPFLFKGRIVKLVKAEVNRNLEAKVEFKNVSLSLFRHFPQLSIGLEDISVAGIREFETDTLLSAERIDASVDLWSVISGSEMKIYGVYLQSPRIHALVNENGKANWEITKEDTAVSTGSESAALKIKLEKYSIEDGYVFYKDESSDMQMEIAGLIMKEAVILPPMFLRWQQKQKRLPPALIMKAYLIWSMLKQELMLTL